MSRHAKLFTHTNTSVVVFFVFLRKRSLLRNHDDTPVGKRSGEWRVGTVDDYTQDHMERKGLPVYLPYYVIRRETQNEKGNNIT